GHRVLDRRRGRWAAAAPRAARRRERQRLRRHLLLRGLVAERRSGGVAATADRGGRGHRAGPRARLLDGALRALPPADRVGVRPALRGLRRRLLRAPTG